MTTYELPPEPPIGSRVKDAKGSTWTRSESPAFPWRSAGRRWSWQDLLLDHGPLTLIEPDPWPTAPLIVATFLDKRCVFGRTEDDNYDSPTGGLEAYPGFHRDTLTNVVPVTVVPTAEWEALVEAMMQWNEGGFAPITSKVRAILAATDALGLDQ